MESMNAKVAQFAAAQSEEAVQKNKLQDQLDTIESTHAQQNSELHAIVKESQCALMHLRREKARYHGMFSNQDVPESIMHSLRFCRRSSRTGALNSTRH